MIYIRIISRNENIRENQFQNEHYNDQSEVQYSFPENIIIQNITSANLSNISVKVN